MASPECQDRQFCLRWNNFQTNITSQFETLRQEEDFVDVTLTCDGKSVKAHKVVLSACSPYFKELFKNNPCKHPIIILKDVQWCHLCALVEFMYAGVVNVSQAQLPAFLRTAESLHILGLTDAPRLHKDGIPIKEATKRTASGTSATPTCATPTNTDTGEDEDADVQSGSPPSSPIPVKRDRKSDPVEDRTKDLPDGHTSASGPASESVNESGENVPSVLLQQSRSGLIITTSLQQDDIDQAYNDDLAEMLEPKTELPDYSSDGETRTDANAYLDQGSYPSMSDMMAGPSSQGASEGTATETDQGFFHDIFQGARLVEVDPIWTPAPTHTRRRRPYMNERADGPKVTLGPGVEVSACQLEALKLSDYRKLTRGLAGLVFTPLELATRSVTGQRWSRANTYGPDAANRKVKPALDNAKVNAIIYHVKSIFPEVEVSRIKQVLAYKCQESSVALKMKAGNFQNVWNHPNLQNQPSQNQAFVAQDHQMNQGMHHSLQNR